MDNNQWPRPKSPLSPNRLAKLANALGVSTPIPSPDGRRSPVNPTSKYLLHVIPPLKLAYDSEIAAASGYHTQFRRGIFVPVHSTLQSQLWAIAKEYALPSTVGLILYLLVDSDPGPRLSEEIWKHLWTRVLKVEQRDESTLSSPLAARSTPHLIRPLMTSELSPTTFPYPSPSTPSSLSEPRFRSESSSQSDPDTPVTSLPSEDDEARTNSLDLPGLNSSSIIPILAKVEFDVDENKANWFEPWLRSRKAKRTDGRPLLQLRLVDKASRPAFLNGQVTDSPVDIESSSESDGDDATASVASSDLKAVSDDTPPMTTNNLSRRNIPPPLILHPAGNAAASELVVPSPVVQISPAESTPEGTHLPYLRQSGDAEDDETDDHSQMRPPASAKRDGGFYEDLDLGLDEDDDPDGHRKSQYELKVQLDEIERNLAQFSPRALKMDLEEEQSLGLNVMSSSVVTNAQVFPPTPTVSSFDSVTDPTETQDSVPAPARGSSLNNKLSTSPEPSSPPKLTVNSVPAVQPDDDDEDTTVSYPALTPSPPRNSSLTAESPLIPLSPDPFGRYPSTPDPVPGRSGTFSTYWETVPPSASLDSAPNADSKSSRFSADSVKGADTLTTNNKRSAVVSTSVKTIKKLWRKSNKNSISGSAPPATSTQPTMPAVPGRSRTPSISTLPVTPTFESSPPLPAPPRPERPSQEEMEIPDIPVPAHEPKLTIPQFGGRSSHPSPVIATKMQAPSRNNLDRLHFDQESPYPVPRSTPRISRQPSPPAPIMPPLSNSPSPPPITENQRNSVRKSILKWKSSSQAVQSPGTPVMRPQSIGAGRTRRPSVLNFGSMRGSDGPEIPPSPQIPDQFLPRVNEPKHLATPSTDSSQYSRRKSSTTTRSSSPSQSLLSDDTRPSIDSSQFEMVSPKIGSLAYPYHSLDNQ